MRIGYILAGLLFFINPNILVVDFLPDFIGAILILYGLAHAAEIDERVRQTRKTLYTLLAVAIGRFLCTFLVPIIDPSEYTWFLVFAFCFGIAEAYLFCRAMYTLDSGLTYLSLQTGHNEIYKNTTGTSLGMTIIFTVVKNLFAIFPALTYLNSDFGTVSDVETNWSFVMWMLMVINVLLVTVYGVLWYIRMVKFWKPLKKSEFVACVEERYKKEYLSDKPLTIYRDLKRITLLLASALLFCIPIRMDGIDILPDVIAGVLLIYTARFLKRMYPRKAGRTVWLAVGYTLVSAIEWGYMLWFVFSNYSYQAAEGFSDVMGYQVFRYMHLFSAYAVYVVLIVVKLCLFVTVFFSMRKYFKEMIIEHTGSITEVSAGTMKTEEVRKSLSGILLAVMIVSVIAALISALTAALFLWIPVLVTLDLGIWAILAILIRYFNEKLTIGMDDKYYYDT